MSETPSKAKASKPAESKAQASDSSGANQYAIVEASGQQFWLQPNRYYDFDRLEGEVGDKVSLKEVLLGSGKVGASLGQPYVKEAVVNIKGLPHRRGAKVIV